MKSSLIQCLDGGGAIVGLYQNGGCDESLKMRLAYSHPGGQHKYKVDLFPLTLGTEINPSSKDLNLHEKASSDIASEILLEGGTFYI